jgi:hypothetical protein
VYLGNQLDQSPNDDLIAGYVESEDLRWHHNTLSISGGRHGDTAFKLATRTQDPERRLALLERAWTDLNKDSAKEARAILEIPELKPDDRLALEERIAPHLAKKP